MQIFLLEDSEDAQLLVEQATKKIGAQLTVCRSVQEAKTQLGGRPDPDFALYILDVRLPDGSGIEFLRELQEREVTRDRPVILLTAEEEVSTKILAFNTGADDYLLKPINPAELRARIESKLRKQNRSVQQGSLLRRGILTLDPAQIQATNLVDGKAQRLDLTAKEFKILYFLMQHENKAFSRADIVKAAWGEGIHLASRTVDSHICALRKKLGPSANFIECIPSLGYRFLSEPAQEGATALRKTARS